MKYELKLKEIRKTKKMSQQDIADLLGVHQTVISDYEKGIQNPSVERLIQLAQLFNMSLDEFVIYKKAHAEYSDELAEKIKKK